MSSEIGVKMAQLQNDLYKVWYFLSRCSEKSKQAGPSPPPLVLAVNSWSRAYDVFYSQLGGGKALLSFRNNLKNVRDLFDGHFDNGRVGWSDGTRKTNPTEDLAVLCANCHRMVHRKRDTALTLDELRSKIRS